MHFTLFKQLAKRFCFLLLIFIVGCAKKSQPKNPDHYLKRAYLELGDQTPQGLRQALVHLDEGIAATHAPQLIGLKASILFELGHAPKALDLFKTVLQDTDLDNQLRSQLINNYACVLAHQQKITEAKELFTQLTTDPYYPTPEVAYFNLAKLLYLEGAQVSALSFVNQALALEKNYTDALVLKAKLCAACGDAQQTQTLIAQIVQVEQDESLRPKLEAFCNI